MEARRLILGEQLLEEVEHRDTEEREEEEEEEAELQLTERRTDTLERQLLPQCLLLLQLRMVEAQDGKKMNGELDRIALLHLQLLVETNTLLLHLTPRQLLTPLRLPLQTELLLLPLTLLDLHLELPLKLQVLDCLIKLQEFTLVPLPPPLNRLNITKGIKIKQLYRKIGSSRESGLSSSNRTSKRIV